MSTYQTLDGQMPGIRGEDPAYATYHAAAETRGNPALIMKETSALDQ
jgi:hypothetical protein